MRRLALAIGLLALAGCDGGEPNDSEVLAEAATLAKPLPGLYRSTTRFESLELPGAAPAEARIARERLAKLSPQVREFCLTPQEAEGGFREMLMAMQEGDCAFERFAANDGRLEARMRCTAGSGIHSRLTLAGEADPQSARMRLQVEQTGDAIAGGRMLMTMGWTSRRIGDCPDAVGG